MASLFLAVIEKNNEVIIRCAQGQQIRNLEITCCIPWNAAFGWENIDSPITSMHHLKEEVRVVKKAKGDYLTFPRDANMSFRSSWSIKPSRFWSIMLKASLNSWIWSWSNIAKTLEVALWALFFVPALRAVFRHAMALVSLGRGGRHTRPLPYLSGNKNNNKNWTQYFFLRDWLS